MDYFHGIAVIAPPHPFFNSFVVCLLLSLLLWCLISVLATYVSFCDFFEQFKQNWWWLIEKLFYIVTTIALASSEMVICFDIFPTLLGHFSTLVPIDNLWHYSAYTPKKSAFYANWFGNAKQLNEKWKILKEIHFFNSASAFFQLWLRMCFSKNPFPCVPFLWKNQLPFPSR